MEYDPKRDEFYCTVCGYTEPANTPHPGRPSEDEIGYYTGKSFQSVDMNLGGTISMNDLRKILKRNMWSRSKRFIIASSETKTFRENMNYMNMIINTLKNEKGYPIPRLFEEEYSQILTKISYRFEYEQLLKKASDEKEELKSLFEEEGGEEETKKTYRKRRNYSTFYVFLAVLFHLLQNNFLEKHKNEILEDLWDASQMYVTTSNKSRFFRNVLSKYNMLIEYLPDYNKTVYDKLMAVSYRFGVNSSLVDELFNYMFNKHNLSNYSMDNLVFAMVFTVGEYFEGKDFSHLKKSGVYTVSIIKIVTKLQVLIKREGIGSCGSHLCFTDRKKKVRGRKKKKRTFTEPIMSAEEYLNKKATELL